MKNIFFFLGALFFVQTVSANELVPFFDEMPSLQEDKKVGVLEQIEKKSAQEKKVQKKSSKPNLGRDAVPIKNLRLAPFPNTTISLEDTVEIPQAKERKSVIDEKDILTRMDPLTMTEKSDFSGDDLQSLIDARLANKNAGGGYVNPLGRRHDADGFLVAGIGFGMTPDEVKDIIQEQGYVLTKVDETLPPSLSLQYEQDCRLTRKLYILSEIRQCIVDRSNEEESRYVKRMTFERADSRETVRVDFTSKATENISYRIFYKNKGDPSLNSSIQNMQLKANRKKEFWNLVFSVYGLPDFSEKLLWGDEDTSFLRAGMLGSGYDAYILLESSQLQDEDYFKWEDALADMKKSKTFNFVSDEDVFEEE